jgi:hypothetical protein
MLPSSARRLSWLLLAVTALRRLDAFVVVSSPQASGNAVAATASSPRTRLSAMDGNEGFSEISGTLARLDEQWRIQQQDRSSSNRWTKIALADEGTPASEYNPAEIVPPALQDKVVYLLEPPNKSNPSCILCFIGGAGLGTFPQVAYNEFLTRLSDRLNAAVLTVPYQVGLDHFTLSKRTGELVRRALLHCEEDPARQYAPTLPTYCLTHSLGGKLASIYMAATGQDFEGVGLIAYNNFGFANTIGMAREFADELGKATGAGERMRPGAVNEFFNLAETVLGSLNFDFSPSPTETNQIISLKWDPERQKKTRLFVFDDDNLDSSDSFLKACETEENSSRSDVTVSGLPGSHLTPVYFQLGLDSLPEEARAVAGGSLGDFENVSFGTLDELNLLVDEVVGFILGQPPSRQPKLLASSEESSS